MHVQVNWVKKNFVANFAIFFFNWTFNDIYVYSHTQINKTIHYLHAPNRETFNRYMYKHVKL